MTSNPPPSPPVSDDINRIVRGASREIRKLLLAAHAQNFGVSPTHGGHYAVTTPKGVRPKRIVFAPSTPSDGRSIHNTRKKLREIGVDLPHSQQRKKGARK